MKTYRGNRGKYSFFKSRARWRWVVNSTLRPLYHPPRKETRYTCYRSLGGPQGWKGAENLDLRGIRSADSLYRSQSLYRLRWPGRREWSFRDYVQKTVTAVYWENIFWATQELLGKCQLLFPSTNTASFNRKWNMAIACPVIYPRGRSMSILGYSLLKLEFRQWQQLPMTATAEFTSLPAFNCQNTGNLVLKTLEAKLLWISRAPSTSRSPHLRNPTKFLRINRGFGS
jgi:hypothetical protein